MKRGKGIFLFYSILAYFILCIIVFPMNIYAKPSSGRKVQIANQALSEWIKFNQESDHKWKVRWDPYTGLPGQILGHHTQRRMGNPQDVALNFITEHRPLLQVDPLDLKLDKVKKAGRLRTVKYRQCYNGILGA